MPPQCSAFTDDELEGYLLGSSTQDLSRRIAAHCRACTDSQAQLAELERFILKLKVALDRVESEGTVADWFDDTDSERVESRGANRLPCNTPVSVRYLDEAGAGQLSCGCLVDRSVEGAALILPDPLPVRDGAGQTVSNGRRESISLFLDRRSLLPTENYSCNRRFGIRLSDCIMDELRRPRGSGEAIGG